MSPEERQSTVPAFEDTAEEENSALRTFVDRRLAVLKVLRLPGAVANFVTGSGEKPSRPPNPPASVTLPPRKLSAVAPTVGLSAPERPFPVA